MNDRQKIEKKLDSLASHIVRNRDANCITCGCRLDIFNSTAGHFMKRRHRGTRWDLRNLNGQCLECNRIDDTLSYRKSMENRYGIEITEAIISKAHKNRFLTYSELISLYEKLKQYET